MKRLISVFLALTLITSLFAINVNAATDNVYLNIYVSEAGNDDNNGSEKAPFATIERAKEEVEKKAQYMTGDIVVNILPGNYHIDETLVFDKKSSGKDGYNVIYKGTSTTEPSIINGGTKITGWKDDDGDGIWTAPAPVEDTRTLYINSYPAQRAQSKYLYNVLENYSDGVSNDAYPDWIVQTDGFKVSKENFFCGFAHPEVLELVWPLYWTLQRTPVEDLVVDPEDSSKLIFRMKQPAWDISITKENDDTNPLNYECEVPPSKCFYIENAIELLDEQGEFYFDKTNKQIHYFPYAEEDLTNAQTYVGTTDLMVKLQGNGSDDKIENIIFDNVEFRYGSWNDATTDGVIGTQTDHLAVKVSGPVARGGISLPAQFTVEFGKNIKILNCKFIGLGSSAIKMENGVSDSLIEGNIIRDVSGTGIMIDSYEHKEIDGTLPEGQERCDNIKVLNNVIHRPATEFMGMPGISMYLPSNSTVSHNDIKRTPYSGMVLGWGWGGYDCMNAVNNVVSHNRMEDVTGYLHDGGHIYTLDTIPGLKITDNYLVKAGEWRGGIYFDSGSEGYTVERNVVEDSVQWLFARSDVKIKDMVAKNNYYAETCGSEIDKTVVEVENNTSVGKNADGEFDWPQEAQNIIANAGLEDEYKHLLSGVDMPSWRRDILDMQPTVQFADDSYLWKKASDFSDYYKLNGGGPVLYPSSVREGLYVPIGSTLPEEWVEYDITVDKTMDYNIELGYANGFAETDIQPKVNIYVDGVKVVDNGYLENTSNWDTYTTAAFGPVNVTEGDHKLRVEFVDNGFSFTKYRLYSDTYFDGYVYDEAGLEYPETKFADIKGHWAEYDIASLTSKGIINGVSEVSFAPEDTLTLYQAVWLVSRCAGIDCEDTNPSWKNVAEQYGLMASTREDAVISREEFAHIIMQGYKQANGDAKAAEVTFPDSGMISEEFKSSIAEAVGAGFVKGDENGYFNPADNLTRAEAATIIARLLKAM